MCLNVFIDIVIEFHHHFLIVMFLPCTSTYTFFFTPYNDSLPNMLYYYDPFFHSRWSIPTFIQSILTFYVYISPNIPHSTFYVVTGCAEHSGAQVLFVCVGCLLYGLAYRCVLVLGGWKFWWFVSMGRCLLRLVFWRYFLEMNNFGVLI
jgi:hypothetical protein